LVTLPLNLSKAAGLDKTSQVFRNLIIFYILINLRYTTVVPLALILNLICRVHIPVHLGAHKIPDYSRLFKTKLL
jgi:hypothetical protein